MKDLQELISFALELADLSREIILSHSITDITHEIKADGSPVTLVDREVEQKLREQIDARYPQHGILGEEYPGWNRYSTIRHVDCFGRRGSIRTRCNGFPSHP